MSLGVPHAIKKKKKEGLKEFTSGSIWPWLLFGGSLLIIISILSIMIGLLRTSDHLGSILGGCRNPKMYLFLPSSLALWHKDCQSNLCSICSGIPPFYF